MNCDSKFNWYTIIFGAIGIAVGFFLNMYANKISNQELLAQLKEELKNYQHARTTQDQQKKSELEGAIKVLESKLS